MKIYREDRDISKQKTIEDYKERLQERLQSQCNSLKIKCFHDKKVKTSIKKWSCWNEDCKEKKKQLSSEH